MSKRVRYLNSAVLHAEEATSAPEGEVSVEAAAGLEAMLFARRKSKKGRKKDEEVEVVVDVYKKGVVREVRDKTGSEGEVGK
jgi:hypothetical protein